MTEDEDEDIDIPPSAPLDRLPMPSNRVCAWILVALAVVVAIMLVLRDGLGWQ